MDVGNFISIFVICLFTIILIILIIFTSSGSAPNERPGNTSNKSNSASESKPPKPQSPEELEAEIARLRTLGQLVVKQRDAWEVRALAAEAELQLQSTTKHASDVDDRFGKLRQLIAREFHPDHVKTEGIEKLVRQEIFKQLWPKVEDISRT